MQELQYESPATVQDAVAELGRGAARALAGGTDLITQMREGRRSVSRVVDLKRIPALTVLERRPDGTWRIGAATSIVALGRDPRFAAEHGALLESARLIGSLQIQSRASLGGNICNAAPSADAVPLLICLGAVAEIAGPDGLRRTPIAGLAIAPGRTALSPVEILVVVELPPVRQRMAAKYLRFTPRREMDIAVVGVGAALALSENGVIVDARITLASVAPVPVAAQQAQSILIGERPSPALFAQAALQASREAQPISDTRGSAEYRRELVAVLSRRALEACASRLEADTP